MATKKSVHSIERSRSRKAAYVKLGIWKGADGIHLAMRGHDVPGYAFNIGLTDDPARKDGHPKLYKALEKILAG